MATRKHMYLKRIYFLLLLSCIVLQRGIAQSTLLNSSMPFHELSSLVSKQGSIPLYGNFDDAIYSEDLNYQSTPFMNQLVVNDLQLDSMHHYENAGWFSNRYHYYFKYDNSSLKTMYCVNLGNSITDSLGITSIWNYDEQERIKDYYQYKKYNQWHDTVVVESEIHYEYLGDSIVNKKFRTMTNFFMNDITYNGKPYKAGSMLFEEHVDKYKYNERGQLIEYFDGNRNMFLYYQYDDLGRIKYASEYYYLTKYEYSVDDTSRDVVVNYYFNITDSKDYDSITEWLADSYYHYSLDQCGRDSSFYYFNGRYYDFKADIDYDSNDVIQGLSFSFFVDRDSSKWFELSRLEYNYSNDYQLKEFKHTFYDERLNDWNIQHLKTYYYGAIKSGNIDEDESSNFSSTHIYPNPVTDELFISKSEDVPQKFRILNLHGKPVLSGFVTNHKINVASLASGIYLLEHTSGESYGIHRFMKE